jgi:hypothetical protein
MFPARCAANRLLEEIEGVVLVPATWRIPALTIFLETPSSVGIWDCVSAVAARTKHI